jgi:hypothetical protein
MSLELVFTLCYGSSGRLKMAPGNEKVDGGGGLIAGGFYESIELCPRQFIIRGSQRCLLEDGADLLHFNCHRTVLVNPWLFCSGSSHGARGFQ